MLKELQARGYPCKPVRGGAQVIRNGSATIAFAIASQIRNSIEQGDIFYMRHLSAVQAACADYDLYPILIDHERDSTSTGGLRCVDEQRVFGVIAEWMDVPMVERLREKVGVVLLNKHSFIPGVDYVIPDVRQAVRDQIHILYELGHRSIACFRKFPKASWQNKFFFAEYWHQCVQYDLYRPPEFFEPIEYGINEDREAINRFLDRVLKLKHPPTAILTQDRSASLLMEECARRGYPVPEKMSIFGFDDRPDLDFPLATYRQNFEGMAREAIRVLLDRCKRPDEASRVIEVAGTTIRRGSIGPARVD